MGRFIVPQETEDRLRYEIGLFFHRELDVRYDTEYLRSIPEIRSRGLLDLVHEDDLSRVKSFFKRVMYPVGSERKHQDRHMERVILILNSWSSIISILPSLPALFLRYGVQMGNISVAGLQVISAYQQARKQEEEVLAALIEIRKTEYDRIDDPAEIPDQTLRRAFAAITDREIRTMIRFTEKIVRLGADEKLTAATGDIIRALRDRVDDRSEAAALDYVRLVTEEVRNLSQQFSRRRIENVLELSRIVEYHYFRNLPDL